MNECWKDIEPAGDGLRGALERMLEAVGQSESASRMLCGIAAATQALLASRSVSEGLNHALPLLVESAGVDRCSVFERAIDVDTGEESFVRRFFAHREGVDDTRLRELGPLSPRALGAEDWSVQLLAGRTVRARTAELTGGLRTLLENLDVRSLLLVPIRPHRATWGYVGFFDLTGNDTWTRDDECVLSALAASVAFAVERETDEATRLELQRRLMANERIESLTLLAGGVAHDVNNLLTILYAEPPDDPGLRPLVLHLGELCGQLMLYAGGRDLATRAPSRLDEIARQTAHLLRTRLPSNVTLDTSRVSEVPLIDADPTQLRQVVMNLITNAAEAVGASVVGTVGVETLQAEITEEDLSKALHADSATPGPYVILTVTDDGSGIAEELRERVFDPLFSTKDNGHGLGLSTVLGVARAHGGGVFIEGSEQRGTSVRVFLPCRPDTASGV